MALPEVKMFMEGANFKEPVFMVTGFKIGREASLSSSAGSERGMTMDGGLNPPGPPAQFGGMFPSLLIIVLLNWSEGLLNLIPKAELKFAGKMRRILTRS
jgi:hypothetical protein